MPSDYVATYALERIVVPTYNVSLAALSINGWIIIQQRLDISLDFNQNWTTYRNGFGNVSGLWMLSF